MSTGSGFASADAMLFALDLHVQLLQFVAYILEDKYIFQYVCHKLYVQVGSQC